jgi:hypothetical protein
MKRSYTGLLIAAVALSLAAPVAASANPIAGAVGNLRWGMSAREVKTALKAKIKDKSKLQELDSSYVEFDGKPTRWDSSPIAQEYTHGNEEAMLTYKDSDSSENYYFFIGSQLWKWVKLYPAASFGGHDFARFSAKVRDRFGNGHEKQGDVNPGSGQSYQFIEFLDRNTRLRAVDKTKQQNQYALMFEAMDTVRSLASLRSNTIRRATAKRSSAVASAPTPTRSEPTASSTPRFQKSSGAVASNAGGAAKNKKSIFSDEQQGDGESDYNAKKQRVQADARDKQRRSYDRTQEAKKGKVLDDLAGMDDDDPISGAH